MKSVMAFLFFFSFCLYSNLFATVEEVRPGEIEESVTCRARPEQSYALYLPSNYSIDRKWPLLLAFDPGGRGGLPVERFREAAEEFGYIVAGSNNSRNGPWKLSMEAGEAILNDVTQRYAVDSRRIYLTGFSGGARVAILVGLLTDWVAGVIACGAGFPGEEPPRKIDFPLVGIAGDRDMNHIELSQLSRTLREKYDSTSRLIFFEGGHAWPPPDACEKAVGWLELQAMRSGLKPKAPESVEGMLRARREEARSQFEDGELFEAYSAYTDILVDFEGLADLREVRLRHSELEGREEVRQAGKRAARLEKKERSQFDQYRRRLEEVFGERYKSTDWWAGEARQLEKRAGEETDPEAELMWLRVLDYIWRVAVERSWFSGDARLAVRFARIAVAVRPDDLYPCYGLARALALDGKNEEALKTLSRAIDLGLSRRASLVDEPAFDPLRDTEDFQKLLARLKDE